MSAISSGPMRPDGGARPPVHNRGTGPDAAGQSGERPAAKGADQPNPQSARESGPDGYQYTTSQQTLQARTDQAYQKYVATQGDAGKAGAGEGDDAARNISAAGATFERAISDEIRGKVRDAHGQSAPYSTNDLVQAYGNSILDRYPDNRQARSIIERAIASSMNGASQATDKTLPVDVAKARYETAKQATDKADQELGEQLRGLNDGLSEEQRDAYMAAYRQKHADVYDAERSAAQALADAVTDPSNDAKAASDPAHAALVAAAVKDLATSSRADVAEDWLAAKFGVAEPGQPLQPTPYSEYFEASGDGSVTAVMAQAVERATATTVADGKDPLVAAKQHQEKLQALLNAGVGKGALEPLVDAFNALRSRNAEVISGTLRNIFSESSPYGKHAVAYADTSNRLKASVYVLAAVGAGMGFFGEDLATPAARADFAGNVFTSLQGGAEGLSRLLKAGDMGLTNDVNRIMQAARGPGRPTFLKMSSFVFGGLGNAFFAMKDIANFIEDPSWTTAGSAVGSTIAAIASFVPGANVAVWLGIGVSALFSLLGGGEESAARKAEQLELLTSPQVGLNGEVAAIFVDDPEAITALSAGTGLDSGQLQHLAQTHPQLFDSYGAQGNVALAFAEAASLTGFTGSKAQGFADALLSDGPDNAVGALAIHTNHGPVNTHNDNAPVTRYQLLDYIVNGGNFFKAGDAVATFAERNGMSRETIIGSARAGDDWYKADHWGSLRDPSAFFGYLRGNASDQAYLREALRLAVEENPYEGEGILSIWVRTAASESGTPADRELLARSIGDACRAGVVPKEEADALCAQLGYGPVMMSGHGY